MPLSEAPAPVALTEQGSLFPFLRNDGNGNDHVPLCGMRDMLPTGPIPSDPGEFVGSKALAGILAEFRSRAEIVLIYAPPVLRVGDARTLGNLVDGIIVVTKLSVMRRPKLDELARQLEAQPAAKLGFIVTDARSEEGGAYGYGHRYRGHYGRPHVRGESGRSKTHMTGRLRCHAGEFYSRHFNGIW